MGPHNGRELRLLLAGKKPLAKFVKEHAADHQVGDEAFQDAVDQGLVRKFVVDSGPVEYRCCCVPTEEWRVKLLELVRSHGVGSFTEDELHRLDGALLGYRKADVERFISRVHELRTAQQ